MVLLTILALGFQHALSWSVFPCTFSTSLTGPDPPQNGQNLSQGFSKGCSSEEVACITSPEASLGIKMSLILKKLR